MSILVRPADLESDRETIIHALQQYLTPRENGRRYDWLYRENPHGQATTWVAQDTTSQAVVGVASAFPRRMSVRGAPYLAWVLGDFCISQHYRSLGPALQLQRAVQTSAAAASHLAGWYDFPSQSMAAVFKRLGIQQQGQLVRMAKPLRVDRLLAKHLPFPRIVRWGAAIGNFCLALGSAGFKQDPSLVVEPFIGLFGPEFTALFHEVARSYEISVERSSDYLNWRYRSHPLEQFEYLVARQAGKLRAYAVFTCAAEDAVLIDLFGVKHEPIFKALLRTLVAELRKRGVATISAPVVEGNPIRSVLGREGFRDREGSPFVVWRGQEGVPDIFNASNGPWSLMQGDRDS